MNLNRLRSSVSVPTGGQVRKLAPIVGLLVAVAVAIPLLLAHSGTPAAVAPLPPTPTVTAPAPSALVAIAPPVHHHRSPLRGPAHNPFVQKAAPAAASASHALGSAAAQTATLSAPAATSAPAVAPTAGGAASTVTRTVTVTVPATSPAPTRHPTQPGSTHPVQRTSTDGSAGAIPAAQRFSAQRAKLAIYRQGSGQPARIIANVARDQLLPSNHQALFAFLGVRSDRRTAVFMLPAGATVSGQGFCSPSRRICTYLLLTPSQRAVITVPAGSPLAGTYVLRYLSVHRVTASGSIVNVDSVGAALVKRAAASVPRLKTAHYGHLTGLLKIALGTLQRVSL